MQIIAAYMLATLGGKESPSVDDVVAILKSVNSSVDKVEAEKVVAELSGKSIDSLISEGSKKLASMPAGGAASAATSSGATPAAAAAGKKEEKKAAEPVEEEEADMGFGLFD
jgi:large subunit ribosomal protein LP2